MAGVKNTEKSKGFTEDPNSHLQNRNIISIGIGFYFHSMRSEEAVLQPTNIC